MVQLERNQGGHSEPVESEIREDDTKAEAENEDSAVAQAERAVVDAEVALAASSADDPDRFQLLDSLACVIDDRHNVLEVKDAGRLPEAVEYAKEARELLAEDYVHSAYEPDGNYGAAALGRIFKNRGTICNTLQTIHRDLYLSTKEPKYLDEGIRYGDEAVEHTRKYQDQYPEWMWEHIYARRTNILGGLYRLRFDHSDPEIGGNAQDLDSALVMYGRAADHTPTVPESYWCFTTWCDLMVIKAGLQNDVKFIDAVLTHRNSRRRKLMNPSEEDLRFSCRHNYFEYSRVLARRWQMTGADEDFQKMIDESRELISYEQSLGEPRKYYDDPNDDRDVLRACAYWMATSVWDDDNPWEYHLPSIETALALMMKLLDMTPLVLEEDFFRRDYAVGEATYLTQRRYDITKTPVHGFAVDDMNVYGAKHNTSIAAAGDGSRSVIDKDVKHCSYGMSAVLEKEFSTFDPPTSIIGPSRLMFLQPVSAETWIRKRNDDGTVELGATEADADVWEFLQGFSGPTDEDAAADPDQKEQDGGAEAQDIGGDTQAAKDGSSEGAS